MEIKLCKECGCEIPIDSKGKFCISCAARKRGRKKIIIEGIIGTVISTVIAWITFKNHRGKSQ